MAEKEVYPNATYRQWGAEKEERELETDGACIALHHGLIPKLV